MVKDEGNDLLPMLKEEDIDLQGLGDGNGGFDLCTMRDSNNDDPGLSSRPMPSHVLLFRRRVPEKSLSGILMSRANLSLITSLVGSCSKGKTSFRQMSDTVFPSISNS